MKKIIRYLISNLLPDSTKIRIIASWPKFRSFTSEQSRQNQVTAGGDRLLVHDRVMSECSQLGGIVDYLEFGVFKGATITYWSQQNTHGDSRFIGFDTFTGLPEKWVNVSRVYEQGEFDTGGQVPNIDDKRVTFVKGLFQDTLRTFLSDFERSPRPLIIHCDADLYSAELYVLASCDSIIKKGDFIIFDDFSSALDDFRALLDWCSAFCREVKMVAASEGYTCCAFQVTR